nr:hypothetical protein [Tanacetum cinerariifolium]
MQTQTSNTLYNVIMEAGGKDCPPMLAQDKAVPVTKGSSKTTTERYMENYKNVPQDIRDQLNAEAEAVQIILTRIDNDFYSTVDACPNACEMWKSIERFVTLVKQSQKLKTVYYHKLYDILKQHQNEVNEIRAERLARTANPLALVAQQQPVYHPQNHPTHYTQKSSARSQKVATRNRGKAIVNSPLPIYDQEPSMVAEDDEIANQDNFLRINRGTGYDNQRIGNVAGAKENVGTPVVQKSGIQCYNYNEYGHVARDCQTLKRAKDAAYHKKKMLSYEHNVIIDSLDMSYDREQIDHDDDDDLANEPDLLASLIEKLKYEIDDSKNRNKFLETSN